MANNLSDFILLLVIEIPILVIILYVIWAIGYKQKNAKPKYQQCPYCCKKISINATKCPYCQSDIIVK